MSNISETLELKKTFTFASVINFIRCKRLAKYLSRHRISDCSTTVTCWPFLARNRAVSQPTVPPPITITLFPVVSFSDSTFDAVHTLQFSIPLISGIIDVPPVPTTTASDFSACTDSVVASFWSTIFTPHFFTWAMR